MAVHILFNLVNDPEILLCPEESYFQANLLAGVPKHLSLKTNRSGCAGEINVIGGFNNRLNVAIHFGHIFLDLKQKAI
ncbi:hypothetical protein D3C73_831880 [compost metagenome]